MTQQKVKTILLALIGAALVLSSDGLIKNQVASSVLNIIGSIAMIESQLDIHWDRQNNKAGFWLSVVVIVVFLISILLSLIKLSL